MEFSVSNSDFLKVLRRCSHALAKSSTIPVLSTLLLQMKGKWLTCTATDLRFAVRCSVECEGKDGAVCLPGAKLISILSALDADGKTVCKVNDKRRASIVCGRSKFALVGEDAGTFPDIAETPDNQVEVSSEQFLKAVNRCIFVLLDTEVRYAPPAFLFESKGGVVVVAGTDSHRIAVSQWNQEIIPFRELVAKDAARTIGQIFSEKDTIGFATDDNHLWFQQPNVVIAVRKVTGSFPDWKKFAVREYPSQLTLKSAELKNSMQRAMICAATSKDIKAAVDLHFDKEDLTLFGQDSVNGSDSSEVVEIKYDGPVFDARFNGPYVAEGITAIGSDEVAMSFKDGKSPFEFRPVPDDGYKYIVMPRSRS
jgi:DNA polymerase-3 subunit beta